VARDVIELRGLQVSCVVGVYPHERDEPQKLLVDVSMETSIEDDAVHERLRETLDYAAVAAQITFLLQSCRFRLVETAAHVLAKLLLAEPAPGERRAAVHALRLSLTKPEALERRAVPTLTIERDAAWARATLVREPRRWGTVDIVHETRDAGIHRLDVAPGATIPLHLHRVTRESAMVLGDGLHCQGRRAPAGSVFRWPPGGPHRYDNPTDRWQTILCVHAPRVAPGDEIEVSGEPADVAPERAWPEAE
jgi:FolB domain-containing protein